MTLRVIVSPEAQERVNDARDWLRSISPEAEGRFVAALEQELTRLRLSLPERIRLRTLPEPDEKASLTYARPIFQSRFQTGVHRRRRSSAGLWRVFFDLHDQDGDGVPEVLRIVTIRHAAAAPLWDGPAELA